MRIRVRDSSPAESIIDTATAENVDLIVMSSHGRGGSARWTFGSVADKVARHSPCPVFLVRQKPESTIETKGCPFSLEVEVYHTILVPLDGSKRAEAILPHVEELARCLKATVVFLSVIEPIPMVVGPEAAYVPVSQQGLEGERKEMDSYLAALQGEFREKDIEASSYVVRGPIIGAIIDAAKEEQADLIAIASHGRTGLSRVFYGSVAAGVLHRIDRPLLLIRSLGEE